LEKREAEQLLELLCMVEDVTVGSHEAHAVTLECGIYVKCITSIAHSNDPQYFCVMLRAGKIVVRQLMQLFPS